MGKREASSGSVMLFLANTLLGNPESCHSCGCYFETFHLQKNNVADKL